MRIKSFHAVAGLGLALVLALTATVAAGAGSDFGAGTSDTSNTTEASIVAANAGSVISFPVIQAIPTTDDVDVHREPPGPTPGELAAYAAAVDKNALEDYAAAVVAATPPPAPAPAPTPVNAAPGSVQDIIARNFGGQTSKAIAVARCESGLNPGAMSPGGGNHGLFQINNVHSGTFQSVTGAPWSARYDAETNTRFAKWLYNQSGWGPWACA